MSFTGEKVMLSIGRVVMSGMDRDVVFSMGSDSMPGMSKDVIPVISGDVMTGVVLERYSVVSLTISEFLSMRSSVVMWRVSPVRKRLLSVSSSFVT